MTYRLDTPATLFDMAEMGGAISQLQWAIVREMWSNGETFAMRDDDVLLGVFGFYPTETGAEAWFNIHPQGSKHMLRLMRDIRLTLASRAYPEIVVIYTTPAGRRIAAACGFILDDVNDEGISYGKFVRRRLREGSGQPAEAGGSSPAAPHTGGSREATV